MERQFSHSLRTSGAQGRVIVAVRADDRFSSLLLTPCRTPVRRVPAPSRRSWSDAARGATAVEGQPANLAERRDDWLVCIASSENTPKGGGLVRSDEHAYVSSTLDQLFTLRVFCKKLFKTKPC